MSQVVGFLGAGQMARALAGGFRQAGLVDGENVVFFDPASEAVDAFQQAVPGSRGLDDELSVARQAGLLFLAVKPQVMPLVLEKLAGQVTPETLVVSIAAGIGLARLVEALGSERVIRVMPNTPCLVGKGASAFSATDAVGPEDCQLVQELMESVGMAVRVQEDQMDAVTGLSGSGPAYIYTVIEALSDAGVAEGLPRQVASQLATQTTLGAAVMVQQTGEPPSALTDQVTSPGGTTLAGLQTLADHGLSAALGAAVESATRRSEELGE